MNIEARINPGFVTVGGFRFARDDLLIEVRKIAQQVARDPRVQASSRRIGQGQHHTQSANQQRSGGSTLNTPVAGENLVGLHQLHQRTPHRGMGRTEDVQLGGGQQFRRQQGWGGVQNQWIRGENNRMARYDDIATEMRGRPRHFGESMRRMMQRIGGNVPGVDMGRAAEHIGIRLQEAQRSPAMLAHMSMEQSLLSAGQTTQAIEGHPAYGPGSQGRMRDTDNYLARRGGLDPNDPDWSQSRRPTGRSPAHSAETAAQIRREANYIAAAIDARGLTFSSRAEAIAEIRRMVFNSFQLGTASIGGPIALGPGGD